MKINKLSTITTLFQLFFLTTSLQSQTLVKDINPSGDGIGCLYNWLETVKYGIYIYFIADDGVHGRELWRSNGTTAGTTLVADLNPGPGSSAPEQLKVMNSRLYFVANDGTGIQLWKLDHTVSNLPVKIDLEPGLPTQLITSLILANGDIYFLAGTPTKGSELWRYSSGTAAVCLESQAGTAGVDAVLLSYGNKNLFTDYYEIAYESTSQRLYWFGNTATGSPQYDLWYYDLTAQSAPAKVVGSPFYSINPHLQPPVPLNGRVYFPTSNSTFDNYELSWSDGTSINLLDLYPGAGNYSFPTHLTRFGNSIYCLAIIPTSNPAGLHSLVEITASGVVQPNTSFTGSQYTDGFPNENVLRVMNNKLFYSYGLNVWRVAPTPSSTAIVSIGARLPESNLTQIGLNYYHSHYEEGDFIQLYQNNDPLPVTAFDGVCHGTLGRFVQLGSKVFFSASQSTANPANAGWELWSYP